MEPTQTRENDAPQSSEQITMGTVGVQARPDAEHRSELPVTEEEGKNVDVGATSNSAAEEEPRIIPPGMQLDFSWKTGTIIIAVFFLTFIVAMVLRSV